MCIYKICLTYLLYVVQGCYGDVCKTYTSYFTFNTYIYCSNGCCGDSFARYCCTTGIGTIAGSVTGGLIIIAILIFLLCIYCSKHKTRRTTRVFTTTGPIAPNVHVSTVSSGHAHSSVSYNSQPVGPPPYNPYPHVPPPAYTGPIQPGYPPSQPAQSLYDNTANPVYPPMHSSPFNQGYPTKM